MLADDEVSDGLSSHLLVDEDCPKRSLSVLYAIAHGAFILAHQWLTDADGKEGWRPPKAGEEAAYIAKCWTAATKRRREKEANTGHLNPPFNPSLWPSSQIAEPSDGLHSVLTSSLRWALLCSAVL